MSEGTMDTLIYFSIVGLVLLGVALYLDRKYDND